MRGAVAAVIALLLASGCAGKGETVPVQLKSTAAGAETPLSRGLKVAVLPFDDKRADPDRLGRRTHLWGGETYFALSGGKAGDVVAQVVADYLSRKGWKASVVKSGAGADGADLTVTGQINELMARVRSAVFHTDIEVKSQIALQAVDARSGTTSRMTLNGERTRTVFWFDEDDVEHEVNQNLEESLNRLIADARANELLPVK